MKSQASSTRNAFFVGNKALPPLPQKMTPSQAARLAEILDFLHNGLVMATDNIEAKEDGSQVTPELRRLAEGPGRRDAARSLPAGHGGT